MSSEWRKVTFGELVDAGVLEIGDGYRARNDELSGDGLIFLRAGHVRNTHIDFDGVDRFSTNDETRFGRKIALAGDVVITTKGNSTGRIAVVTSDMPRFVYSPHLSYWRSMSEDVITQGFLRAWARSSEFSSQLEGLSRSTDMAPYLSLRDQRRLEITLPPGDVQRGVDQLSDALSMRLELLREVNATLEAIAQALFKSWFVDFDPVRAKMAGRAPEGMDEATAALFPDALEETSLGMVPKGWRVGCLEDLLVLQRGFDLPSQDRKPGAFPIIAASGPAGTHAEAMARGPGVVTGRSGVLGRVFLTFDDYWPLNTTLWVKEFRASTPCYAYELLRLLDFKSFNAGSAVPTLNRNHVHGLPYIVPEKSCVEAFEAIARELHQRARHNEQLAQSLTALRDELLPRLVSGQLCLASEDAENVEVLT